MKKSLLIAYIFLCFYPYSKAQIIKLYNNPNTNKFTLLELESQDYSGFYQLYETQFTGKLNAGQSANYFDPLNFSKQYPVNNIIDSLFILQQELNNLDTLYCYSDTINYELGNYSKFQYINHAIDYSTNQCYRLLLQSKWSASNFPTFCNQNYYILKSKGYAETNNFLNINTIDSIEKFYKFPYPSNPNKSFNFFQRNNNSYYLTGIEYELNTNTFTFDITELDSNLSEVQYKSIVHQSDRFFQHIDYKFIQNKNYFISYSGSPSANNNMMKYDSGYIWIYDTDFNALDSIKFNSDFQYQNYFSSLEAKHYFFFETDTGTVIKVTNNSNDTIRTISLPTKKQILVARDSSFYILNMESSLYYNNGTFTDIFVYNWSKTGKFIQKVSLYELNLVGISDQNPVDVYYAIDSFNNVFYGYFYDYGISSNNYVNTTNYFNLDAINFISGNSSYDFNNNCSKDTTEIAVKNILLELKLNNKTFFTNSDEKGNFRITPSDTGHGKLIVHLENQRFFVNACTDTFDVFISDTTENPFIEVLLQATPCKLPKVSVSMVTPFLRRCFDNNYTLSLTNETADTITAAYADVSLDDDLIPVDTAFNNALALGNNTYRFYFYDLLPFQTVRKHLLVNVNCATTLPGEAHCVKVVAFPYNSCVTVDFPRLTASSECRNDSVLFLISRNALPDNYSVNYRILSDETITHTGTLNFTNTVNTQLLAFANPDGKTLRFESYQIPAYPNEDTVLSASVEGCGNDTFSIGYLTLFPPDDDVPFMDIDCQQNVGSFDPNEKAAQPNGYGDSSYILPNTALEYIIHFQNKGTFAASIVTITDTLAASFDLTTFQFIASSHAFTYSTIDSNILQFNSINIYLPAEQDDTLGSMGFIKFSIKPKTSTPIGTTINNTAAILFDYNDAIITNTVNRTINDQFLKVSIVSNLKNNRLNIESKIFPNPFHQTSTLAFNYPRATTLTILSLDGKVLQQLQSTDNQYTISRNNNSNGMYIYELRDKESNELLDIGKLIIQ